MSNQTNQCCCCTNCQHVAPCCACLCEYLCVTVDNPSAEYAECKCVHQQAEIRFDPVTVLHEPDGGYPHHSWHGEYTCGSKSFDLEFYLKLVGGICHMCTRSDALGVAIYGGSFGEFPYTACSPIGDCNKLDAAFSIEYINWIAPSYDDDIPVAEDCGDGTLLIQTKCGKKHKFVAPATPHDCLSCPCTCKCVCMSLDIENCLSQVGARACWSGSGWSHTFVCENYEQEEIDVSIVVEKDELAFLDPPLNTVPNTEFGYCKAYVSIPALVVEHVRIDLGWENPIGCPNGVHGQLDGISYDGRSFSLTIRCALCDTDCDLIHACCFNDWPRLLQIEYFNNEFAPDSATGIATGPDPDTIIVAFGAGPFTGSPPGGARGYYGKKTVQTCLTHDINGDPVYGDDQDLHFIVLCDAEDPAPNETLYGVQWAETAVGATIALGDFQPVDSPAGCMPNDPSGIGFIQLCDPPLFWAPCPSFAQWLLMTA